MLNSVIIKNLEFKFTFNNSEYYVVVNSHDTSEDDTYGISIYTIEKEEVVLAYFFTIDSSCSCLDRVDNNLIIEEVINYLSTIIREF